MDEKIKSILASFPIKGQLIAFEPIEVGHINATYKIIYKSDGKENSFVLQKINTKIFKKPEEVMENIAKVGQFLHLKQYPKKVLRPIQNTDNQNFTMLDGGCWRLFPFIENTLTYDIVDVPDKAYTAAYAFGEYAYYLSDFEASKLYYTIPNFHNTNLRYQQFIEVIKSTTKKRLKYAQTTIFKLHQFRHLLKVIKKIKLPLRVVHSDTKINNILFDKTTHQPVCVIDLDTLMPGTLIYDYGDMVRTFTPTLDENSDNFRQIAVRQPILKALTTGYLDGLNGSLTTLEEQMLNYGARLTIFEQALRFLTDYLQGNIYYKVANEQQNLVRAKNQVCLLESLEALGV